MKIPFMVQARILKFTLTIIAVLMVCSASFDRASAKIANKSSRIQHAFDDPQMILFRRGAIDTRIAKTSDTSGEDLLIAESGITAQSVSSNNCASSNSREP